MTTITGVNNLGTYNNLYPLQNKGTVQRPSTIIKDASKTINNIVEDTSKNIKDEKEKLDIEVSNARTNISAGLGSLREASMNIINSAVTVGAKASKAAISIGQDVAKVTTAVGVAVTTISLSMNNPNNGIISKGVAIHGAVSTAYGASKEPVNNIKNSVSNLSGDIKAEYSNVAENFQLSKESVGEIKGAVVSVGSGVKNYVSNVASHVKDAGKQIASTVSKSYNDIIGAYKGLRNYNYTLEDNSIMV
ncbi:MAG: hypothetical protein GX366_02645 [Epulopiscium sp.]|nr:hypothetical protein [Candidatus Epulonipiscium sp.]